MEKLDGRSDSVREPKIYRKILVNFTIALGIFLLVIIVVPKLLGFFMPFVIGWVIAQIANPLVKFMEKRIRIVRKHSSAIIIIVVLVAVILILYFLIILLAKEISNLLTDLPSLYQSIQTQLQEAGENLEGVYQVMPAGIKAFIDNLSENLSQYAGNFVEKIDTPTIGQASSFAKNVVEVLFMSIITILSSYFFIVERDNLVNGMKKITPKSVQKQYVLIIDNFKKAFGGYFKAQFKIMLVITAILFIGLEILGVHYSFLLALGIALLDLLPVFGTGAVIWPWAIIDFITGNYKRAIGFLLIYLVCQVVKQLLQPKMVGDSIGLNPLATLIFMFIGYKIKGVFGLIIGIPIGMVLINFYRTGLFNQLIRGMKIIVNDINEYRKF